MGINIGQLRRRPGSRQSFPSAFLSSLPGPISLSSLSSPLPALHLHPTVTPLHWGSHWCCGTCHRVSIPLLLLPHVLLPSFPLSLLAIDLPVLRRSSEGGATEPSPLEEQEHPAGVSGP